MTLNPMNQRAVIAGGAVWTLALLGCVGALAQSMSTRDPGGQLALQTLLNQRSSRDETLQDLFWALITSREFSENH